MIMGVREIAVYGSAPWERILLIVGVRAFAGTGFHCYSFPNVTGNGLRCLINSDFVHKSELSVSG